MGKQLKDQPSKVRCPKCGRPQTAGKGQDLFYCHECRMQFDNQPDEGGDYSDRSPSARLEREERRVSRSREIAAERIRRGDRR
jgi:ribosomal protein L37AE/L43A